MQTGLVAAQVALTSVLLIAAGLLIRSFYATQTVELGFNPAHLFVASISLTSIKYDSDDAKTVAFWDEVMTKIRQIAGVTDAAMNENPPLNGERWDISPFTVAYCSGAWDRHATCLSVTCGESDPDQPYESSKRIARIGAI
jgi:hypothetical protein